MALRSAEESLVLLKNDGILPLDLRGKKVAVIGWHAASARALFGGYHAMSMKESSLGVTISMAGISVSPDSPVAVNTVTETYPGSRVHCENPGIEPMVRQCYPGIHSLLDALQAECPEADFTYAPGYAYAGTGEDGFAQALEAARQADVVICTLGGHYGWNMSATTGEGIDSADIGLPPCQEKFLRELAGFARVPLQPGESRTVTFTLPMSQLAFLDLDGQWKVEAGEMTLLAGGSSKDLPLQADLRLTADGYVDGKTRGFYAAAAL